MMSPELKPNDQPYKRGKHYTGKEHVWDEAFGYWGAAAHGLNLTAKQNYDLAKMRDMEAADYDKDDLVDLKSEMNFSHAYYAAAYDKGGKTDYYRTVTQAFVDGRKIIADANGEKLSPEAHQKLAELVKIIESNWEKVIAESVFKYAGSVYKDLDQLHSHTVSHDKAHADYAKHWGELKGFAMTLQLGKSHQGQAGALLNKLTGFGPVVHDSSWILGDPHVHVTGIDAKGDYTMGLAPSWEEYKLHMLEIQKLMIDEYGVKARVNDMLADMPSLKSELSNSGDSHYKHHTH